MSSFVDCSLSFLGHRTTALVLGFKQAIVFAQLYAFFGAFAWYSFLLSDTFNPEQNIWVQIVDSEWKYSWLVQKLRNFISALNMDWFYYIYLWYCFLMIIAAVYLIQGVRSVRN